MVTGRSKVIAKLITSILDSVEEIGVNDTNKFNEKLGDLFRKPKKVTLKYKFLLFMS